VLNGRNNSYVHFSSGNIRHIRVNGSLLAFDREQGRRVWERKLESAVLLLDEVAHSPLLVVGHPRYVRQGNVGYYMSSVGALDKFTGQEVVKDAAGTNNSGYHSLTLDLARNRIELKTYNNRLRIVAQPPAAAESKPKEATPAVAEDAAGG
jgi:outer membrane protein assembly factor BamB